MISSQFIQSCLSGDETAIQTLVRTYQRSVFQLALSIIDDAQEVRPDRDAYSLVAAQAEAATRQTFIAAISRIGRYREGTNFETWLYTIAIQISRKRARSWKRRRWLSGLLPRAWGAATRLPANEQAELDELKSSPLLHLERSEQAEQAAPAQKNAPADNTAAEEKPAPADPHYHAGDLELWSAVRRLDENLRVPVVLRYYHDFPVSEIAHLLHISEGNVHARLDAARERIARDNIARDNIARENTVPENTKQPPE